MAILIILVPLISFAQTAQTDSIHLAKYRTEVGLDMSVFNFDTKQIYVKVM